jgi:hypothetical protein
MSKRESKTDPPVPQIVGFRIDKLAERSSGYEGDEQEELSESSVPFLPPTKEPPKEARQANVRKHDLYVSFVSYVSGRTRVRTGLTLL